MVALGVGGGDVAVGQVGLDGSGVPLERVAVAASAAGEAADGVALPQGHAVGLEAADLIGATGVDDDLRGCSVLAAQEAPGGVAGAFEPQAHLGVGGHLVLPDDAVASPPPAGAGGVLAVAVVGDPGGELGLEHLEDSQLQAVME